LPPRALAIIALAVVSACAHAGERPVARPGPDLLVGSGETVTLSAKGSEGVRGKRLRYRWQQAGGPKITIGRRAASRRDLKLTLTDAGVYLLSLTVTEGRLESDPETVRLEVPLNPGTGQGDRRPVAVIRQNCSTVTAGENIVLDGSGSSDADGDKLEYRWSKAAGPAGDVADSRSAATEIWALAEGEYVIELMVHDGLLPSRPAEVRVRAASKPKARVVRRREGLLEKQVPLDLTGANLQTAVELFPSRVGLALTVDPGLMPPERMKDVPVSLRSEKLSVRKLCDWIGRLVGASYVVRDDRAVLLTRGYGWFHKEKLAAESYPLDGLKTYDDAREVASASRDLVKAALFARPDASVSLDAKARVLTAILPVSAQERMRSFFSLLRAPRSAVLGAPEADEFPEKLLAAEVVCRFEKQPLGEILAELSEQTGVSLGFDVSDLPGAKIPTIGLALGTTSLERAIETITARTPFAGYLREAPSGVWFYCKAPPLETSEHLWTGSIIAAYDLRNIIRKRKLGGRVVEHLVRQRIWPETWRDPSTSICFNVATGRLVAANAPCVQAEVGHFLSFLEAVGYKRFAAGTLDRPAAEVVPAPERSGESTDEK